MKRSMLIAAAMIVLVGLSTSTIADEKVDNAINDLDGRFAKIKSYTSKTETMTDNEFGPGHTHKTEMTGASEWVRKNKKALMRSEAKHKTTETLDGKTTTTPSTLLTIDDGEFLYVLTEDKDKKMVMKNKSMAMSMHTPKGYFQQFKSYYVIKLLDDAKVNGNACYVFEMKMKPMEGMPPSGRQLAYFQKDIGLQVKSEAFDAKGKLTLRSISTDIKINADISSDRFKFKSPEGAQVIDNTKPLAQPTPPATKAETKPAKKPEETKEKKDTEKKDEGKKKKKGIKLPGGISLP